MKRPLIIGITGGTGSGKSTVSKEIFKLIPEKKIVVIEQDSYYKDQSHLTFEELRQIMIIPPLIMAFIKHLKDLLANKPIENLFMILKSIQEKRDCNCRA